MTLLDIKKKYKRRKMGYMGDLLYKTEDGGLEVSNYIRFKTLGSKRGYEINTDWLLEEDQGERVMVVFEIKGVWDLID